MHFYPQIKINKDNKDSTPAIKVTSVRYAGSAWGFQEDGLTIYEKDWFQYHEIYVATNTPAFDAFSYGGSLIVTGRNTWTLYE